MRRRMRVEDVRWRCAGGERALEARLVFEGEHPGELPVWFRASVPGPEPVAAGDAFLAGFLVPSLFLRERLVVDAPVSQSALDTARSRIAPLMRRWFPECGEEAVEPRAVVPAPAATPGRGVGCMFSSGVDSWYSLLRNRGAVSHLIHLHGLEIDVASQALADRAREHVAGIARERGLALVTVATNLLEVAVRATRERLEQLGRRRLGFGVYCYLGHLLVAPSLFLRDAFERILVPASWPVEFTDPRGSHPLIEPAWSAPDLAIELDGADAGRVQKLRALVAAWPEALDALRVCIDQQSERLNCGRCLKCARTLLELRAAGVRRPPAGFAEAPSLPELMRLRLRTDDFFFPDLLREARRAGDPELVRAVEVLMGLRWYGPRLRDSLRRALSRRGRRRAKRWLRRQLGRRQPEPDPRASLGDPGGWVG